MYHLLLDNSNRNPIGITDWTHTKSNFWLLPPSKHAAFAIFIISVNSTFILPFAQVKILRVILISFTNYIHFPSNFCQLCCQNKYRVPPLFMSIATTIGPSHYHLSTQLLRYSPNRSPLFLYNLFLNWQLEYSSENKWDSVTSHLSLTFSGRSLISLTMKAKVHTNMYYYLALLTSPTLPPTTDFFNHSLHPQWLPFCSLNTVSMFLAQDNCTSYRNALPQAQEFSMVESCMPWMTVFCCHLFSEVLTVSHR